jgi:hypothetical protein
MGPAFVEALPVSKFHGIGPATSAKSGWNCTSRGTTVPTESEKLTLVTGFAFKRVIDSMTRARWLSFRLAETLTLEDDGCAVLAWLVAGWFAGATLLLGFALLAAAGFDYLLGAPYRSAPARKKPAAVRFGLVRGPSSHCCLV